MHLIDYIIIVLYLAIQIYLGRGKRMPAGGSAADLIVGGRLLTLPAFVASLVSTWYGGILGVGEYSYRYGLSNWLVLGVPYYVAALLFGLFLARRVRQSELLTIPERLGQAYDNRTALVGSVIVFLMAVPAAYIVMVGVLFQLLFGWPFWLGLLLGTLFSTIYVYIAGFNALVRADKLQFGMMFLGFIVLLGFLVARYGGWGFLQTNVPPLHLTWHGGRSSWYIGSWYVIALATLVEPAFFQRCYAAASPKVATRGILISIACWALFDFLTTSCGLYARAILPNLADPVGSFPALATQILPAGIAGLFAVAMLATVMSTVDSYSFIAASTFSNDIVRRLWPIDDKSLARYTRIGLAISTVLAVVLGLFFRSAVDLWYAFGSIGTPALMIPVVSTFLGKRRLSARWAAISIITSGGLATAWYLSSRFNPSGDYWLGLEPIFSGLVVSILIFVIAARTVSE